MFWLNDFKLLIEPPELLAHPVDVGRQRAQLVAIDDMDALREVAGRNLVEPSFDLLDRPDQRPGDGIAEGEGERDAAEREGNDDVLRAFVRLLARFDTRDHVRLGLVDQLVGQTLEAVGQGCGLCRLHLSRLRGAAGANHLHDLRDDFDEPIVVLPELAEQLDFVLGHELQPIHVVAELVELAKRARQRRIVGSEQGGGHAVELARRVMLHLPIRFDLALQLDELLGALH